MSFDVGMSSVNPIKFLNRGPDYLRTAFQTNNKNQKPQLSAAERLNIQRVRKKEQEEEGTGRNRKPAGRGRPATAPPKPRSEFETCTAENLLNRNCEPKNPGYAARILAAGNLGDFPKRPNTAQPYALQQRRRLPVKANHNLGWGCKDNSAENLPRPRSRSSSVDKFFDTLGGTMIGRSNPPSLVPSGSVSDLSGLSRAASQCIRSASSSTLDDLNEKEKIKDPLNKKTEVSQVEKRIRVMMWLSNCKPQPHFSTPVKG